MDFLKKAKAQLAEVQGDLSKATASLGLGDKKGESNILSSDNAEASSSNTTPVDTPATSVAPSIVGAPKAKLPLAIRKNVRDKWETAQPDLEQKITDLLGVPWRIDIDVPYIYRFAEGEYAKNNPGDMIKSYVSRAYNNLEQFVYGYGEDGKSELNTVASSHTITMDLTSKPGISYTACEIAGGALRILFVKGHLGTNISESLNNLTEAINEAGTFSDKTSLDFNARSSIKIDYEPKVGPVKAKLEKILALPAFELEPNFEHNYAAISEYAKHCKPSRTDEFPHEWQKQLGRLTLDYFSVFVDAMEKKGYGDDEMIQEGFKEAVEKNQIALRIVATLKNGKGYNECVVENGVLYIQTTAKFWGTNVREPADKLMDIL